MKELWHMNSLVDVIIEILPNAIFDTDSSGEIIIATGYKIASSDSHIVPVGKEVS